MAFTIGAWAQDVDIAGANTDIDALQDNSLFTSGDDIRVPEYDHLMAAATFIGSGGNGLSQISSPSLRRTQPIIFSQINGLNDGDVLPDANVPILDFSRNPIPLVKSEQLRNTINTNTSAASFQSTCIFFSGAKIAPVTVTNPVMAYGTNTDTVTARVWHALDITYTNTLPSGTYQVVGGRATSASLIAWRLIFKGSQNSNRPGAIGTNAVTDFGTGQMFRWGNLGVWGEFSAVTPPSIEVLCNAADSSLIVQLDLNQVS